MNAPLSVRILLILYSIIFSGSHVRAITTPYDGAFGNDAVLSSNEQLDTIGSTLDDLVVESATILRDRGNISYLPTKSQKEHSSGGIDILRLAGLNEIYVNPITNDVSTLAGENVSYFIDGVASTKENVENLAPADIKKIELLFSPEDPRYNGAGTVLNYCMVEYSLGGYTKLYASQACPFYSGDYRLYSKLGYKKMQFDLSAAYEYSQGGRYGYENSERYSFLESEFSRLLKTTGRSKKKETPSVSARAIYSDKGLVVSNSLALKFDRTPYDNACGVLEYDSPSLIDNSFEQFNNSSKTAVEWKGWYFFPLPSDFSISFNPYLTFYNQHELQTYSNSDGVSIENDIKETSLRYWFDTWITKKFGPHSFSLRVDFENDHNKVDYAGTSDSRITERKMNYSLGINFNLSFEKTRWFFDARMAYQNDKINKVSSDNWIPHIYTFLTFQPAAKHTLRGSLEYAIGVDAASKKSPVLVIQDDLNAIEGNPDLKAYSFINGSLTYAFTPVQNFSTTFFAGCRNDFNPSVYAWEEMDYYGQPLMLRQYVNSGSFFHSECGLFPSVWFFNRKLMLQAAVSWTFSRQRGIYSAQNSDLGIRAYAQYQIGRFLISAYFQRSTTAMTRFNKLYSPSYHSFDISYGIRNFNVKLSAKNPFNAGYLESRTTLESDIFQSIQSVYSPECHRKIVLTMSYTFRYGKKKVNDNEMESMQDHESSILK